MNRASRRNCRRFSDLPVVHRRASRKYKENLRKKLHRGLVSGTMPKVSISTMVRQHTVTHGGTPQAKNARRVYRLCARRSARHPASHTARCSAGCAPGLAMYQLYHAGLPPGQGLLLLCGLQKAYWHLSTGAIGLPACREVGSLSWPEGQFDLSAFAAHSVSAHHSSCPSSGRMFGSCVTHTQAEKCELTSRLH